MTAVAAPPQDTAPAPATEARSPSLLPAELRRFRSRRFIRLLLGLALLGYLVVVGAAAATSFAKTTPEQLADARRNIEAVVQEQEGYRQQCLKDPNRPTDAPVEQFCGPPASP